MRNELQGAAVDWSSQPSGIPCSPFKCPMAEVGDLPGSFSEL